METTEIVVVVFCGLAMLAAPAWVIVRFVRPPRPAR